MADSNSKKKILVLGATGMLGSTMLRYFMSCPDLEVTGSSRSSTALKHLPRDAAASVISGIDVENYDSLSNLVAEIKPDFVINCIGLIKQDANAQDPLLAIPVNSMLPHRLSRICAIDNARLIHLSTDCVFSGSKGMYTESDTPDATDLYGLTKLLGEVDNSHTITLRTSMVGRELLGQRGLIEWFLSQSGSVQGFKKAIFSGLTTIEIARVMHEYIMPSPELSGIFHLSTDSISKYDLLKLVADCYGKVIDIIPNYEVSINRSLDSSRFRAATGYVPKSWKDMIRELHDFG